MKKITEIKTPAGALPYIQKYIGKNVVIKYGGNAMLNEELKSAVMKDVAGLADLGIRAVLVHGGGPEISSMLASMGKETKFINGLRYTDAETAEVAAMVLAGKVNKSLVALIQKNGGKAIGLCGLDGGMLQVEKMRGEVDLGFVGEIKEVDISPITAVLDSGFIPVIATVGADAAGQTYNINADTAAAAIAGALKAEKFISMTDVKGLLRDKDNADSLISKISVGEVPKLMEEGVISGGMIPKIQACVDGIRSGVREVSIIDGRVGHAILSELSSDTGIGTLIYGEERRSNIIKGGLTLNSTEIKERDKQYVLGTYARNDLCIAKGSGAACWSSEGKKYIDFSSGIGVNSLGYCDEGWISAVTQQLRTLQHTSNLFYTGPCGELAELLVKRTGYDKAFFCNSGAEANEGAIKAARKYSNLKYGEGRHEIITLLNSFHGRTMTTITATGQDHYHKYFDPFAPGFLYAAANDIEDIKTKISGKTCAVMVEFIQGEGGVNDLDRGYIKELYGICKEKDILFIDDEIQTGIGRTGKLFAYEHFGVVPDIVTMAKGLGAGLPIGAILFGKGCSHALTAGDHGTTFGGNPAVCAGGVEVMKRLDGEFLKEVAKKGEYMRARIGKMEGVSEVTGIGMMIGISPVNKTAKETAKTALEQGLIALTAHERIRLLPPLTITYDEIDEGLAILEKALA
jgi:acetylornithine/N-succinyldiaminopimelate aminotransferase